jgi:hypothetical protein
MVDVGSLRRQSRQASGELVCTIDLEIVAFPQLHANQVEVHFVIFY